MTSARRRRGLRYSAYGSAALAFASAAVSAYWMFGGRTLLSTVGGPAEELAMQGGPVAAAVIVVVVAVKIAGGMLGLALVQQWGRRLPQRLLTVTAAAGAVVLTLYGGLLVVVGGLALLGAFGPPPVDATALRWHVFVWDLWFLLWGLLLGAAVVLRWRRSPGKRGAPLA